VKNAIDLLSDAGVRRRKIVVYVLFNHTDSPQDFFERIRDLMEWGAVSYPMRFEPLDSLVKNKYVAPRWTRELIEMVTDARRVLGTHGAFPPYEGLKKKFDRASCFEEAFELRPPKRATSRLHEGVLSSKQLTLMPLIESRKVPLP
jgi:hypothetical protein